MVEQMKWMKGKTFSTLAQAKKFTILDVSESSMTIKVMSTGNERPILRSELEEAWKRLFNSGTVAQKDIYDTGSWNSAFVMAILSNLPGVSYKLKPTRLLYKRLH